MGEKVTTFSETGDFGEFGIDDPHRDCRYREVKLVAELRQLDEDLDRVIFELNRLRSKSLPGSIRSKYRKIRSGLRKIALRLLSKG